MGEMAFREEHTNWLSNTKWLAGEHTYQQHMRLSRLYLEIHIYVQIYVTVTEQEAINLKESQEGPLSL
ncbi:hypothetical protein ACQP3J_31220, partial [Escherichia coli]